MIHADGLKGAVTEVVEPTVNLGKMVAAPNIPNSVTQVSLSTSRSGTRTGRWSLGDRNLTRQNENDHQRLLL
jgi:hypothetical protein